MNEYETQNQETENTQTDMASETNMSGMNVEMNTPEKKSMGQIIGIVLIVVIIIIGGLYFYGKSIHQAKPTVDDSVTAEEILAQPDETTASLEQQSSSDEVADIETDLNMTDLNNLDAELQNINAEFGI